MDLQFILDPYACVAYMINYINKSNRGMSQLLKDAILEINDGNVSLRKKFHRIGMNFIVKFAILQLLYLFLHRKHFFECN